MKISTACLLLLASTLVPPAAEGAIALGGEVIAVHVNLGVATIALRDAREGTSGHVIQLGLSSEPEVLWHALGQEVTFSVTDHELELRLPGEGEVLALPLQWWTVRTTDHVSPRVLLDQALQSHHASLAKTLNQDPGGGGGPKTCASSCSGGSSGATCSANCGAGQKAVCTSYRCSCETC